ncbi:MAG: hypothetical protein IT429_15870 [Gemmataceae bacterium]|nr:hypothetical protein [Gemmataceae bacterium]
MEELRDPIASRLEELSRALCNLERRTEALERAFRFPTRHEAQTDAGPPVLVEAAAAAPSGEAAMTAGAFAPLCGWALMGLAGAYLLRAVTESGAIPGYVGAGTGIVYAAWWLFLAAHRAGEKPLFSTVHGLTAALILAPMLWEMAVRFRLISTHAASAILVLFAVMGLGIAWRRNISSIAWISTIAGLVTATALFRESHDAVVWTGSILAIALAVEISACRDRWLSLRWIVALAANLSVLTLAWMGSRAGEPGEVVQPPGAGMVLAAQILLLTIYIASTVDRTLFRGLTVTGFEIGQAAVAFVISVGGALRTVGTSRGGALAVGAFCLLGGAACYLVSFAFLEKHARRDRNFFTYSTFAALLATAGCWVLLAGPALAAAWAALAAGMLALGFARSRDTLRIHGAAYLVLAAASARLVQQAFERIFGVATPAGAAYGAALAGALACYAVTVAYERPGEPKWFDRAEAILAAGLAALGLAGLAAGWLAAGVSDAAPLRTALLTAFAIGAAWLGASRRRAELTALAWPLMGAAALKLAVEDFPQGRSLPLVLSLLFFGGGLIVLPRLARSR